jgi:hypothetical protein
MVLRRIYGFFAVAFGEEEVTWFAVYIHSGDSNIGVELVSTVDYHEDTVYGDVLDAQTEKLVGRGVCEVTYHS